MMWAMVSTQKSKQVVAVLSVLTRHQGKTMLSRIGQGQPFKTLVATMLSARVRDEVTEKVVPELLGRYPNAPALARGRIQDIQKLIRRVGLYRLKSERLVAMAQILVRDYGGRVPDQMEELLKLPGVGRKTAGCVVVYAFGGIALPVDTHVHRISNRLGWVTTKSPEATEQALHAVVPKKWWSQVNDLLVHHGKTLCKPLRPNCSLCPIAKGCLWARTQAGQRGAF